MRPLKLCAIFLCPLHQPCGTCHSITLLPLTPTTLPFFHIPSSLKFLHILFPLSRAYRPPSQYHPRPLIHLLAFHLIVTLSEKPLLHPLAPLLLEISYSPLSPWSTAINCGISCSCLFSPLECKIYKSVNRVHFAYCCIPSI